MSVAQLVNGLDLQTFEGNDMSENCQSSGKTNSQMFSIFRLDLVRHDYVSSLCRWMVVLGLTAL